MKLKPTVKAFSAVFQLYCNFSFNCTVIKIVYQKNVETSASLSTGGPYLKSCVHQAIYHSFSITFRLINTKFCIGFLSCDGFVNESQLQRRGVWQDNNDRIHISAMMRKSKCCLKQVYPWLNRLNIGVNVTTLACNRCTERLHESSPVAQYAMICHAQLLVIFSYHMISKHTEKCSKMGLHMCV